MLAIELRNAARQLSVRFDILALSDLPLPVVKQQLRLAQMDAVTLGGRYYFLVTTDLVRGWDIADGSSVFEQPTASLFATYARNDAAISAAGPHYLAALTQAWLADLGTHWRSGSAQAPCANDMQQDGMLVVLRSAAETLIVEK